MQGECEHRHLKPVPEVRSDGLLTGRYDTHCLDCKMVVYRDDGPRKQWHDHELDRFNRAFGAKGRK
jgi:hypothetical protein